MEDALVPLYIKRKSKIKIVLILVLMEDALVHIYHLSGYRLMYKS